MDKPEKVLLRAKITYFFKETFRARSKAEYKEIFSRGLNEDNSGITGAFPWLYVRAFFALFILFTINTLVLRLTNNTLYVPSVTFLGGITFTIPFIVLLFELYPKRNLSLFLILSVLVGGGTAAGVLSQLFYSLINTDNPWVKAVASGCIEEFCKIIPAIAAIELTKRKNPYACFLVAASVAAGFSVIEDMGYIFYYSDKYVNYYSDVQATIALFLERGLSSFCTHILWTGAVGWAYCMSKKPFGSLWIFMLVASAGLHVCWNLPLEGWVMVVDIVLCVIVAAAMNIAIVHVSRIKTLASEVDLTRMNEQIILEAKKMGESMRFKNAGNLTFALNCTLLSVIILLLCSLPIGVEYKSVLYDTKEEFISFVEDGFNLEADRGRKMKDPYNTENNFEERKVDGELTYVVQCDELDGYDGKYYYAYYVSSGELDSISVELERSGYSSRYYCTEYKFEGETVWVFEVNTDSLIDFTPHKDGTVTAILDADEFEGYDILIGLCAAGAAIAVGCTVILTAFIIKLRRVKGEYD